MKNKLLEEIIIALSLSNLLFIKSWRQLIYPSSESYHIKLEPYPLDYLGVLLSVLLMTAIFGAGLWISRRINKGKTPFITKLFFLGIFIIVLNGIRFQFFENDSNIYLKFAILAAILLIIILALSKWRKQILSLTKTSLIITSPFVLFTFSQAVLGSLNATPQVEPTIPAQISTIEPKEKPNIKNRVVWIVFDELDYFVAFGMKPPKIDLPEFNKLKNESLFATNAVSPAYKTIMAMPALLTGKMVEKSAASDKRELMIMFDKGDTAKFSETPNIFKKIKEMNGDTAMIGWYHPYCRVIGKDLSACQWESFNPINDFEPLPLPKIMLRNFLYCSISLPFGYRLFDWINPKINGFIENSVYSKRHHRMIESSKTIIGEPKIDLVLIHLPFPHLPGQFNRLTNQFDKESNYLDNLALSDKVLGELRQHLEKTTLWEDSTIIVSSDHQWRLNMHNLSPSDQDFAVTNGVEHPNIPFLLKLKGQKESVIYDKPFNTVITHDLILALMKGEISTAQEAKTWLDKNATP